MSRILYIGTIVYLAFVNAMFLLKHFWVCVGICGYFPHFLVFDSIDIFYTIELAFGIWLMAQHNREWFRASGKIPRTEKRIYD